MLISLHEGISNIQNLHMLLISLLSDNQKAHLGITCKFGNFRENFIFANSDKIHICDVKNSRVEHDLPVSVNDSDSAKSRGFYFRENKTHKIFRIYTTYS